METIFLVFSDVLDEPAPELHTADHLNTIVAMKSSDARIFT
jgi:hypothetical protein